MNSKFYIVIEVKKHKSKPVRLCLDRITADEECDMLNARRKNTSIEYQVWARNALVVVHGKINLEKSL